MERSCDLTRAVVATSYRPHRSPKSKPIVTCPSKMFFPLLRRVLIFCIAGLLFFVPRARGNIGSVSHPARRPAICPSEIIHLSGSGFRRSDRNHSKREGTVSSSLNWARPNPLCVMEPPEVNPISLKRALLHFSSQEKSVRYAAECS
jgi:hypothetical protein